MFILSLISLCLRTQAADNSVETLSDANSQFAIDLYHQLSASAPRGNIFYSPLSVSAALAMTYLGARAKTADEMATVLGFSGQDVHPTFKRILTTLDDPTNNYTLAIANRLFASDVFQFKPAYIEKAEEYYSAGLEALNFRKDPEGSRAVINDWVENKTLDKIIDFLPPGSVTSSTIMFLVNAIYFKGLWKFPFDKKVTENMPFIVSETSIVDMEFMTLTKRFNLWKRDDLGARIVEIPYEGGEVSMFIILPNDKQGLAKVERKLTLSSLVHGTGDKSNPINIRLIMPKFKLEKTANLKTMLFAMGIKQLFMSDANLTGIGPNLMVQEVTHEAFVDVNEEGTEAAAVTGVQIVLTSVQLTEEFKADHPFLFYIQEKTTDSILFMGRLTESPDPSAVIGVFNAQHLTDTGHGLSPNAMALGLAIASCFMYLRRHY